MGTPGHFKLLNVFTGLFVAILVIVPPLGSKFIAFWTLNVPGGTLVFPLTFVIIGVLTEVYGFERSRRLIWIGMGCQFFSALIFWLVGIWPAAPFEQKQAAYMAVLGLVPRITLGSFTAYFCGEFVKSGLLSKMKFTQQGRGGTAQVWRFISSSVVGEFIDSAIFITIGFGGTVATRDILTLILTLWLVKLLYEILLLPFTLWLANRVKKIEGIDKIDQPDEVNYNPFASFLKWD
jgi:queuosine precursor transporter